MYCNICILYISNTTYTYIYTHFSLPNLHAFSNSNPQLALGNGIHKLAHILATLIQYKLERLRPRLTVIRKPIIVVPQTAHIALDHAFEGRILLEIENLRGVKFEVILDNVVMGDIVAPALGADVVRGAQRVLCCSETRRVGIGVVEMGDEWVCGRGKGIEGLRGSRRVVEMDVEEEAVFVSRVSLFEFASNGAVGGADV